MFVALFVCVLFITLFAPFLLLLLSGYRSMSSIVFNKCD